MVFPANTSGNLFELTIGACSLEQIFTKESDTPREGRRVQEITSKIEERYKNVPVAWAIVDAVTQFLEAKGENSESVTLDDVKSEIIATHDEDLGPNFIENIRRLLFEIQSSLNTSFILP